MKFFLLVLAGTLITPTVLLGLLPVENSGDLIDGLLQVPFVVGLIYLVLKLEDKRQESARLREESFRAIVDSLLGVIVELSTMVNPGKITSEQIKHIEDYLRSQYKQRGE